MFYILKYIYILCLTLVQSYSGDGRYICAGGDHSVLSICDTTTGEVVIPVDMNYPVNSMDWNPKHDLLAVAVNTDRSSHEGGLDPRGFRGKSPTLVLVSLNSLEH